MHQIYPMSSILDHQYHCLLVAAAGVPACFLAIQFIDRVGCQYMIVIGLSGLACCLAILGVIFQHTTTDPNGHLMLSQSAALTSYSLLILTNFFLNFGPNLGTYVIPAI